MSPLLVRACGKHVVKCVDDTFPLRSIGETLNRYIPWQKLVLARVTPSIDFSCAPTLSKSDGVEEQRDDEDDAEDSRCPGLEWCGGLNVCVRVGVVA